MKKNQAIKKHAFLKGLSKQRRMAFFFLRYSFFLPEILKFLLICKLGTDDVTRCVCEGQNRKSSISLQRMKQCNGNFAWTFNPV